MSNRGRLPRRSLSSSRLPERVTAIASTTPWWKCNAIRNAGSAVRLTKRPASPVFMVAETRVLKRRPTSAPGSDSDLRPCLHVRITRKRPIRHRYSITSSAPPSNVITIVRSVRQR